METIRNILAATDLSAGAARAARRAGLLAADHGARLTLLHVAEHGVLLALQDVLDPADLAGRALEQARMQLAAMAGDLERLGIRAEQQLREGDVLGELNAAAGEADLLAVGASGANALRASTLGTTAERLVRLSRRPVLVVRGEPVTRYRRVLAAIDFPGSSGTALRLALQLAPAAEVILLHCYPVPFEGKLRLAGASDEEIGRYRERQASRARRQIEALAAGADTAGRSTTRLKRGDPRRQVVQAARQTGADLVAMGKHGRSLLGETLLGSTTSWVVARAPCDVLIAPGGQAD